ncbi:DNA gyrase inhibitor YacG [Vibrio rhizosphaerae]|uniref:DNA gyrase inhibitor YacG n=1 Tax=Vibrio rhizosphaerae TaxID=398736 RepID=A0ABU4IRH7_9VIBR|nr:DNA gyrase inhibitor YacG [Vibrio rhizosphaerae]MDW6091874.1 DNA gyrase inhibitor YacG [Vibrio rhizosphaerae]
MTNPKITTVQCPQCGAAVVWGEQSPFRPFCSKQCQMIDFGSWANEENVIPSAPDTSDTDGWSEDNLD